MPQFGQFAGHAFAVRGADHQNFGIGRVFDQTAVECAAGVASVNQQDTLAGRFFQAYFAINAI